MDEQCMLDELAKAQKGDSEQDEVKELDVKDLEKMDERGFLEVMHKYLTDYLAKPPRADKGPIL